MSSLPYPPPRDEYCKYGNRHPNGILCGQCKADAEKREQERLGKQAEAEEKARKRQEIWNNIIWLKDDRDS